MDVTLGPWTAAHPEHKALAEAMGDEAFNTASKTPDVTATKAVGGKPGAKGYTISGRIISADKHGITTNIFSAFTIWVDGTMSNVPPIQGNGSADAPSSPEDAVRAITEARITKILQTLKTGRVIKAG
jgi:hypothetical protein